MGCFTLRPIEISAALLAIVAFQEAATQAQEILPYDDTVTLVVDKRGLGDFTTIMAAVNHVKSLNDASVSKRYSIQIVPSPTPYDECVDVSNLRYAEISGLGGLARIDFTGRTALCDPSGQDIAGCRNAAAACGPLTIRNLSVGAIEIGDRSVNPPGDNANYRALLIQDVVFESTTGSPFLRIVSCHDPAAECSFTIDGITMRSEQGGSARIDLASDSTGGATSAAHATGAILNSYVHSVCTELGLLRLGPLGAGKDSNILVKGNTFLCDGAGWPANLGGVAFVAVEGGLGTLRIVDNQFVGRIANDVCGSVSCTHAAFHDSQISTDASEAYVQDNTVTFVMEAAGLANDTLAFLDLGVSGLPLQNSRWYLSGNDFRIHVAAGDFNLASARDVRLRDGADSNTLYMRDQQMRYGALVEPGSTSSILPWPTHPTDVTVAKVSGGLTIPSVTPQASTLADGQVWLDTATQEVCYLSNGRTFCARGKAPCGNAVCETEENPCLCSQDCGPQQSPETSCADGIDNDCDSLRDDQDPDCATGPACLNSICESGETCLTCADCEGKQSGPASQRFCCGNGIVEGPEGDGSRCDGNY
jgi:hypothetical protein